MKTSLTSVIKKILYQFLLKVKLFWLLIHVMKKIKYLNGWLNVMQTLFLLQGEGVMIILPIFKPRTHVTILYVGSLKHFIFIFFIHFGGGGVFVFWGEGSFNSNIMPIFLPLRSNSHSCGHFHFTSWMDIKINKSGFKAFELLNLNQKSLNSFWK